MHTIGVRFDELVAYHRSRRSDVSESTIIIRRRSLIAPNQKRFRALMRGVDADPRREVRQDGPVDPMATMSVAATMPAATLSIARDP